MEKELFRLASFSSWPENLSVNPPRLARTGFYYCGEGKRITCYKCGVHFDDCSSFDSIVERHKIQSPNCQLLSVTNTENIPLPPVPIRNQGVTESDHAANCCGKIQELYRGAVARATKRGVFSANPVNKIDRSKINYDQLCHEKLRLDTFYDWPSGAHADPHVLAREGLYYFGEDDRVRCVFCKGFMRNWEPTDVPSAEHKKHFPQCNFVRGLNVGNIPMNGESSISDNSTKTSDAMRQEPVQNAHLLRSECTRPTIKQQIRYDAPPNCYDPPKFPEFSGITQRISSFKKGQVSRGHTAEALAEAGWFFIGPGDKVQCFQCGGNLKDWEPEDDPWEEHRRWYANCSYIRTQQPVMTTRRQLQEQTIPTTATSSAAQYRIEPREIKARMDTTKVRAILNMGYPRALVRKAIEDRLSTTGDDFPNAESLLEEIFRLEATNPSGLTSTVNSSAYHDCELISPASAASRSTPTSSTSSSRSTPSYSGPLHFSDSHSLFAPDQSSSSALPMPTFQSLSVGPSEHLSASATVSTVNQLETVADAQSKAKGKRKRIKKKKATGASNAAAREDDEQVVGVSAGQLPEADNSSQLEELEDLNLNENPDEETLQFVEENRRLREARTCKVCMDAEVNTVFLPCGHLVCCNTCSPALRTCPICRTFIRGTVKTFLS